MDRFYDIPKEVEEDLSIYRLEVEEFLNGNLSPVLFKASRVVRGVYEQRTPDTFMMRIRVPAGGLTALQMEKIAELSPVYGHGICHVTTRQDVQLHWVTLEDTPVVMGKLLEVGLTTKGGGGNTVRNITACSESGICPQEIFDVSPYAIGLTEYLIQDPASFTLPRKYKIAFSGCASDCAFATVNDLGFIARTQTVDGAVLRGFRVYVAGGMGVHSRTGDVLEEFIPEGEVPYVAEAIKRLFDQHGNRKDRRRARLRFVMEQLGYDAFKRLYRRELNGLKQEGEVRLTVREGEVIGHRRTQKDTDQGNEHDLCNPWLPKETDGEEDFRRWLAGTVMPQKQKGYYYVKVWLPLGDIAAETLSDLAAIVRAFGEGAVRTTQDQNLIIRWVHEKDVSGLYGHLQAIGLARSPLKGLGDLVCCAGASTCKLGLCLSRGLAEGIAETLAHGPEPEGLGDIKIRISGCPNACGQHPIASLGFHGVARRVEGHLAPYYSVLLGGRVGDGTARLADALGIVPARKVPDLVRGFLQIYAEERRPEEGLDRYVDRRGRDVMRSLVETFSSIPTYEENRAYYRDWGSEEDFSLAGRGPGECGAGVFDMIEVDLDEAKRWFQQAQSAEREQTEEDPVEYLYKAVAHAARALLVTRGLEAKEDDQAFAFFEEKFIEEGWVSDRFRETLRHASEWAKGKAEGLSGDFAVVGDLVEDVRQLYASMDSSLRFDREEEKAAEKETPAPAAKPDRSLDLKGVACPFNYVRAKLELEEMELGQLLELWIDEGEPIRNVPQSLADDGQTILETEQQDTVYRLLVRKNV